MLVPSKVISTSSVSRLFTHDEGKEILYVLLPAEAVPPALDDDILACLFSGEFIILKYYDIRDEYAIISED